MINYIDSLSILSACDFENCIILFWKLFCLGITDFFIIGFIYLIANDRQDFRYKLSYA